MVTPRLSGGLGPTPDARKMSAVFAILERRFDELPDEQLCRAALTNTAPDE
jgi:hypothetical protein